MALRVSESTSHFPGGCSHQSLAGCTLRVCGSAGLAGVRTCVSSTSPGAAARPVPTTLRSTDAAHSGGSVQVQRVEGVLSVESQLEMYSEGGAGDWLYSLSVWSKVNLTGKDITV